MTNDGIELTARALAVRRMDRLRFAKRCLAILGHAGRGRVVGMGIGVLLWVAIGWSRTARGEAVETHWAFRRLEQPEVPEVRNTQRVRNDIDRFLQARMEALGMEPANEAGKSTWLRRVTFDLTGLPPTPEELRVFLADDSASAWGRVVDRLLASPRYGERWGRHWMDVVRYADTAGDNADYPVPELHRYRDYVIDSFQADKPYDQFIREQLAGDILADRGDAIFEDGIVATGFLALSRRYGTGPYELWHLTLENTIETVGQAFLGLNLKCARCHDHKFDPVTMGDYYGLYGIFSSTEFPWAGSEEIQSKNFNRQKFVPLLRAEDAEAKLVVWRNKIQAIRDALSAVEKEPAANSEAVEGRTQRVESLKRTLRTLERPGAPDDLPVAYAVREGRPVDVPVQRRGEPASPGPVAPRCVPGFLAGPHGWSIPEGASGRLEFARWLTEPTHPLTARVMVNRLWQHHFGVGLVTTPNNLGLRGDAPVHRELLDYLAVRFVESGWSVKAMHRLILDSAAYRRASDGPLGRSEADPGNRMVGRFERLRLDAEAIRDAMLFVGGDLDTARPGPHPFPTAEKWTWTQHTPFKELYETRHRSVYLMTQRLQRHPFLALFDGPDTNTSTEARRRSIVPQQALFAMNHPWVDERARGLARQVLAGAMDDAARLRELLERAWSRTPSESELRPWLGWLGTARRVAGKGEQLRESADLEAWTVLARVALTSNEFFYVD